MMTAGSTESMSPKVPLDFESGVLEFAGKLRSFIRRRVENPRDAEDLAQEVFLKVFKARGTLRDPSKIEAWLYQTARGAIIDHFRRRRPSEELPVALTAETHEFDDLGIRLKRSVRRFLLTLPTEYRRPLELAEFDGLTAAAIAGKLGLSETAVKSRLSRGRAMLRERLLGCCQFEFDPFGRVVDFRQKAPCACDDDAIGGCEEDVASDSGDGRVTYGLATEGEETSIVTLLSRVALPSADLTAGHFLNFGVARSGGRIVGSAGIELHGKDGLLRSVAVDPGFRRKGVGRRLVKEAERLARQLGVKELYLLTTTAETFFSQHGYVRIQRSDAPPLLTASSEFSSVCPKSAVLMKRTLLAVATGIRASAPGKKVAARHRAG